MHGPRCTCCEPVPLENTAPFRQMASALSVFRGEVEEEEEEEGGLRADSVMFPLRKP